jgi:hypothetical protein
MIGVWLVSRAVPAQEPDASRVPEAPAADPIG